jgi:hypothetical protein
MRLHTIPAKGAVCMPLHLANRHFIARCGVHPQVHRLTAQVSFLEKDRRSAQGSAAQHARDAREATEALQVSCVGRQFDLALGQCVYVMHAMAPPQTDGASEVMHWYCTYTLITLHVCTPQGRVGYPAKSFMHRPFRVIFQGDLATRRACSLACRLSSSSWRPARSSWKQR